LQKGGLSKNKAEVAELLEKVKSGHFGLVVLVALAAILQQQAARNVPHAPAPAPAAAPAEENKKKK